MKPLLFVLIVAIITGCASMAQIKRADFQDCIISLSRKAEIPPLKALAICNKIYGAENKDLKTEEDLEKNEKKRTRI
jgi:hypothetical protein